MALDNEEFDELVPLSVCNNFSKDFLLGFKRLMEEIGFDENVDKDIWNWGKFINYYFINLIF